MENVVILFFAIASQVFALEIGLVWYLYRQLSLLREMIRILGVLSEIEEKQRSEKTLDILHRWEKKQ